MSCIHSRKERIMLRIRLLAAIARALLAGLAVATIAGAQPFDDDDGPPARDYAFGAGSFGPGCWETHSGPFCTTNNYTARLLGVRHGPGGRAWGEFQRRNHVGGGSLAGRVMCMNIEEDRASIGGFLTVAATPQPGIETGDPFLLYVEDNGEIVAATPDRISALVTLPEGDPDRPLMPAGFPYVCPSADSLYGYRPLTSGDITVTHEAVGLGGDD
jgi:hypothetical protein